MGGGRWVKGRGEGVFAPTRFARFACGRRINTGLVWFFFFFDRRGDANDAGR